MPPADELKQRAGARVTALRRIVVGGASLVGLEVSGIQRFVFDVPTNNAGLEVKARSFLVALLPKVLAWRARRAAGLGDEHEVLVAAGRAFMLVPSAVLARVREALHGEARALREQTGDDLAVDVAEHRVPEGAIDAAGEGSFSAVYEAVSRALATARLRRAEGEPEDFWAPSAPAEIPLTEEGSPFAALGRKLRATGHRISAVGVAGRAAPSATDSAWSHLRGITLAVGVSIADVAGQLDGPGQLLLRTDGEAATPLQGEEDEVASLPLAGTWIVPDGEGTLDFDGLAKRSEGDAKLGVLRLDVDALGAAFRAVVARKNGDEALRDRLALSDAVSLACGQGLKHVERHLLDDPSLCCRGFPDL